MTWTFFKSRDHWTHKMWFPVDGQL